MANEAVFMPVLPSFDGFFTELSKNAKRGGEQAGKDLAGAMDKSLKQAEKQVDTLAKAQERAQNRAADAADKTRVAQLRLSEAMEKGTTSASKLADLTAKYEKAQREQASADKASERASKDLQKAQGDLQKATDQAGDSVEVTTAEIDNMTSSMREAGEESKGLGDKIMSGLGKIGTGALLGAGAKIGATVTEGIGTAFSKGFSRLQSIEQAETMLGGLGNSAAEVESIMDSAMESVSGTAYGFGEAASMAATFSGAGIKDAGELTRVLTLVGDSAAIAGADFNEMGSIWTKLASNGRLSTDEMNQLMDRGLGLLPKLQEHYGVTADEARKMVTDGKVSFQDFSEIMEDMVGGSAQAMGETFSGSAANMQAALGRLGAKFLDPIYANAPAVFQAIGGAVDKLGEHLGPLISDFAERLNPHIENFAQRLGPWLEDSIDRAARAVGDLVSTGKDMIGWLRDNQAWIKPVVAVIGGAATAWYAWTTAIKVWQKATKIAAGVQVAFNAVMAANPIMLAVMAIGALVAGLVYFFTQTETGREMWSRFTDALSAGWDRVVEALSAGWSWVRDNVFTPLMDFVQGTVLPGLEAAWAGIRTGWDYLVDGLSWAYESIIKPVFDGFMTAGKILFAVLATAVLTPLQIAWNYLSYAWQKSYENIIRPTIDAFAAAGRWLWANVLSPVFGWIQAGWTLLSDGIKWAYENIILVAWSALQNAANWLWSNVLSPVFGYIQTGWSLLADGIKWYYENVILVAWSALQAAATWMYEKVIQPVFQWIGDRWTDMSSVLYDGYVWIKDKVFGGLQAGLDVVKGAFEVARDAIGKAWDGIKAKAAAPVKFVIDTVFNNGIVEAWNKVAEWVGLDPIDKYEPAWLGQYAEGTSRVPGPRTKHDNVHMVSTDGKFGLSLRGGEGVVVPEVVDALGPAQIDGMNAAAKMGGTRGVLNYLGGFAGGGVIGSITDLVGRFFPGMSITSTLRPGDTGHHGSGLAVDFSNGTDSTPEMRSAAKFFHDNYGPALLELIHSPSPYNIKNGQNVGDGVGLYGAGTMNAHRNHVHIAAASPLPEPGQPITPVPSGGVSGGVINWLRNKVADTLDGIFGPIGSSIPDFGGLIGGLPKAAFEKMTGAVSSFIRGKADASGAYFGDVGAGVEQWRGLVEDVLTAKGFSTDLADTVLRRMNQESGGNPRAINNWDSNAAAGIPSKGLMQVIDPTFAAHKDAGFNDIWDPEANLRASMNYAMAQYGSLPSAYNRAGGYHDGGLAPAGRGFMAKTALEPEMVLNPAMTRAFIDWMNVSPESMSVMAQEIMTAFAGGDWGYGELASTLGNPEVAKAIVNGAAALGEISRANAPILAEAGKDYAQSALDLVGMGGLVEIADGVVAKVGEITSDEEFQEAVKKVQLDPEGYYSGREIARKLEELGLDVEEIKSRMGGSLLGGITAMV